jgi:hypothetical protein
MKKIVSIRLRMNAATWDAIRKRAKDKKRTITSVVKRSLIRWAITQGRNEK